MGRDMRKPYWILFGPEKNWKIAFKQGGIWGVKRPLYSEWKALEPGDCVFFFATKPISGVIGVGRIQTKFIQRFKSFSALRCTISNKKSSFKCKSLYQNQEIS